MYQDSFITNWDISNSLLSNFFPLYHVANSALIRNCVMGGCHLVNGSFILQNTILLGVHSDDANSIYQNCLGINQYPIPAGNNNLNIQNNYSLDSVFVGYGTQGSFSNDSRWVLRANSPAKGTGIGGTDMGMFGGTNPYKLSGMPGIPAFYKLTAPSATTSTNPYTLTFSVRSNN